MPRCNCTPKVSAYHDGELSELESRELGVHLSRCPECSRALREMGRLSDLIQQASDARVPGAVLARLREGSGRMAGNDLLPVARFLTGFATALLVVSLSVSILSGFGGRAASPVNQDWEEIAAARELDVDTLEEPEVELTQWVVTGLSGRTAR